MRLAAVPGDLYRGPAGHRSSAFAPCAARIATGFCPRPGRRCNAAGAPSAAAPQKKYGPVDEGTSIRASLTRRRPAVRSSLCLGTGLRIGSTQRVIRRLRADAGHTDAGLRLGWGGPGPPEAIQLAGAGRKEPGPILSGWQQIAIYNVNSITILPGLPEVPTPSKAGALPKQLLGKAESSGGETQNGV